MNKEELEEAMRDIYSVVYETILDYQEDDEEEDADYLLRQLELVQRAVAFVVGELQ